MRFSKRFTLVLFIFLSFHPSLLSAEDPNIYRKLAVDYADNMIEVGRDEYGEVKSPSFVDTLDLRSMSMPRSTSKETTEIYVNLFRADDSSTGCNPMYHIDLHQLLNHLTDLTGDPKYAKAGQDSINWFFHNTQSEKTGFVAWGEHLSWDLIQDEITIGGLRKGKFVKSDIHEFYGPWIHWKTSYEVAPEETARFADGLWEHQIYDHETCHFSRHARYSHHSPAKGYEFLRQVGFYLDTWASIYEETEDEKYLEIIGKFLAALKSWQHPQTGLLPFESRSQNVSFILHNLSFTVDAWEASQKLPDPLKTDLQEFIRSVDESILNLKHDLTPSGKGFPKIATTATGEVTNEGMYKARAGYPKEFIDVRYAPYGGLWASVYGAGSYTDARHALLCAYRYRQVKDERYKNLVLLTADRYINSKPSSPSGTLTPKTIAPVMALLNEAYKISGERKYLDDSRRLADLSREIFFKPGIPFPHVSEKLEEHPYYMSISYGDSLMLMFLELGLLLDGKDSPQTLQCTIR